MADALDRIYPPVAPGSAEKVARSSLPTDAPPAGVFIVLFVEPRNRRLLQPLHAAGILHHPGNPGVGFAGRGMAAARTYILCRQPGTPQRPRLVDAVIGRRRTYLGGRLNIFFFT